MESKNQHSNWSDFFSFRQMIALQIMQVLYVLVAIVITVWALVLVFTGGDTFGGIGRTGGLLLLVFGNIFWRVWCELLIVMFRINKTLNSVDENTKRQR